MLAAFQSLGYGVDVVMGSATERRRQVGEILHKLASGQRYDFLYSESSTTPTLLTTPSHLPLHPWLDYRLFSRAKKAGIPMGLFYRDIYWRFPEYREHLGAIKTAYAKSFYYLDLWVYRNFLDAVFVPSSAMLDYVPGLSGLKRVDLPPGAADHAAPCVRYRGGPLRVLYVGGIGGLYDIGNLYAAIRRLPACELTICCRKDEWARSALKAQCDSDRPANIKVVHLSGDALEELYSRSHVLSLSVGRHVYRTFAMPYKLFEYIAHRGPILCTSGTAAAQFVSKKGAGIVVDDSAEAVENAIREIMRSPDVLSPIYEVLETLPSAESWTQRAISVRNALCNCQSQPCE
jgi:hypothetical protein